MVYKQSYLGGPAVAESVLQHLPFLARDIEHDLASKDGRERERLEILLSGENVPVSEMDSKLVHRAWEACSNRFASTDLTERLLARREQQLSRLVSKELLDELLQSKKCDAKSIDFITEFAAVA